MYLKDLPNAVQNISHHLDDSGIVLLICGSPDTEYQEIVDLLVKEKVKTTSFYNVFENLLSNHFIFEKRLLKGQLSFSDIEDVFQCFQRELREEYQTEMNNQHVQKLREFFQRKGRLTVENGSVAYICRHP